MLGPVKQVFAWIRKSTNEQGWVTDTPVNISWIHSTGERQGSWEAITSHEMIVRSDYFPEDEWFEISGTRGFIWVNRCTGKALDVPPLTVYSDGQLTDVSLDEIEWDWAASFREGMFEFVDSTLSGVPAPLSGKEGKYVLQFARRRPGVVQDWSSGEYAEYLDGKTCVAPSETPPRIHSLNADYLTTKTSEKERLPALTQS
jgi:hypothetical protein